MADQSMATPEDNAALEHSRGGATTRQDGTDAGVPMLQGDPSERQGPEDALGPGPKRGDYSTRLGDQYHPHISVIGADGLARLVPQTANASDRGETRGIKGGADVPAASAERALSASKPETGRPALPSAAANAGYDPASLPALPWSNNTASAARAAATQAPGDNSTRAANEPAAPAVVEREPAPAVEQPRGGVEIHNETADKGSKTK